MLAGTKAVSERVQGIFLMGHAFFMHDEYLPARAHTNVYVLCMCQCSSCVVWECARVYVRRYANVLHVVCAHVYVHRYVCLFLLSVLQSFFANYNTYSMMWYTWGTWRNDDFPCIIFCFHRLNNNNSMELSFGMISYMYYKAKRPIPVHLDTCIGIFTHTHTHMQ